MKRTLESEYQLCAPSVTTDLNVGADLDPETVSAEEEEVIM